MERTIQRFPSFRAADEAEARYYRSLTPEQRLEILLELVKQGQPDHETERRLARVYRIAELSKGEP